MLVIFRRDRFHITWRDTQTPLWRYTVAAVLPLAGAVLVYFVYSLSLRPASTATPAATPWGLLLWFPLGAIGEELGWRGYLHKRLDPGMTGIVSSVIVGTMWALWHVGMYQNGPLYMAFSVLLMVSYAVVNHALVADAGFSVMLAAVFHLMINIANLFVYTLVNQLEFMIASSLVWAAIAVGCVVLRRTLFTGASSKPVSFRPQENARCLKPKPPCAVPGRS